MRHQQPVRRALFGTPMPTVSPERVIAAAQGLLGNDESPGGSNCNAITRRFGLGCCAWCDETVYTAWFNAGFNDGRGNFAMPGLHTDYALGDAYVPNTMRHFQAIGRFSSVPIVGAAGCHFWSGLRNEGDSHIVIFCRDNGDGTVLNIEGNHNNRCEYVRRPKNDSTRHGYCLPVYAAVPAPPPTPPAPLPPLFIDQGDDDMIRAQRRKEDFDGHPTYDVFVSQDGAVLPHQTADGRQVKVLLSQLHVIGENPHDLAIDLYLPGKGRSRVGVPSSGGVFTPPFTGLASVVSVDNSDLVVEYDRVCG